ncbi:hypothetical protein [Ornithinimicrobium kibberense]|uniref:Uncharacterized protein n=1 Tax=Ornithinimicrobium kibberense TaxID=282060 RepID=A0ABV5V6J2_9MICO|nr:hypothetical protein [Ornithinimicrobium kibberense]
MLNLTSHPVTLYEGDAAITMWPPEPTGPARTQDREQVAGTITVQGCDVPLVEVWSEGEVTGLPEPRADTLVIVSRITAMASSRTDVVFPYREHRDAQGRVDGCHALARWRSFGDA